MVHGSLQGKQVTLLFGFGFVFYMILILHSNFPLTVYLKFLQNKKGTRIKPDSLMFQY